VDLYRLPVTAYLSFNPCFGTSMPNETEAMALALIRLMHEATDGKVMQWRRIRRLDGATEEAVAFAIGRGWLLADTRRRISLTALGLRLAEELGKPLN